MLLPVALFAAAMPSAAVPASSTPPSSPPSSFPSPSHPPPSYPGVSLSPEGITCTFARDDEYATKVFTATVMFYAIGYRNGVVDECDRSGNRTTGFCGRLFTNRIDGEALLSMPNAAALIETACAAAPGRTLQDIANELLVKQGVRDPMPGTVPKTER